MKASPSLLLALLPLPTWAYPRITSPAGGSKLPGGKPLKVEWEESGDHPLITDLTNFELALYSGDDKNPTSLLNLLHRGTFTSADTATTVTIPVTEGAETTNAYFIGMISVAKAGGTYTTYSSRFTLTGMTGSFAAAVSTALLALSSTVAAGPPPVNNLVEDAVTSSEIYGVAYNLQTGTILYASMPLLPPTSITATNTEPLYPTSSVAIATTYLDDTNISTTYTQAATYSFSSHTNTASAAPMPTTDGSDMAKFLRRWRDDDDEE